MKVQIEISKILSIVTEYYAISVSELQSQSRKDEIVKVRQMYCYLANEYSQQTFKAIGKLINRDHATVIFSSNKVRIEKEIYSSLREQISDLTEKLLLPHMVVQNVDLLQIAEYNSKIQTCLT